MKFTLDGADIPDELISAVVNDEAIFLCGSGVSNRANLPLFNELAELVYKDLNLDKAKEDFIDSIKKTGDYDRVFSYIENITANGPEVVRKKITEILSSINASECLKDHKNLLQLSKNPDNKIRILTTNFDALFEKAAKLLGEKNVPCIAGKDFPDVGGTNDYGIMHLHGRIADTEIDKEESDIILTSANLGDAYLRDGWISRYLEDRMRFETIILVGYEEEDSAFRLLMEALEQDRLKFKDLKPIYAIGSEEKNSAEKWKSIGIKPIVFSNDDQIYESIEIWSRYSESPLDFGYNKVCEIIGTEGKQTTVSDSKTIQSNNTPSESSKFDLQQFEFYWKEHNLLKIFDECNPAISWLPYFNSDDNRLQSKLVNWISKNFCNIDTIQKISDFAEYINLRSVDKLESELSKINDLCPEIRCCWKLIFEHFRTVKQEYPKYELDRLNSKKTNEVVTFEIMTRLATLLRPKFSIDKTSNNQLIRKIESKKKACDILKINCYMNEFVGPDDILSIWPQTTSLDNESQFLNVIVQNLIDALELAVEAGIEKPSASGISNTQIYSIEEHDYNERRSVFFPIVNVIVRIWNRIAEKDINEALKFVADWIGNKHLLIRRISIYAVGFKNVPSTFVYNSIKNLSFEDIFLTNAKVDISRLINLRWKDLDSTDQSKIESRILKKSNYPLQLEKNKRHFDRCVYDFLNLIHYSKNELGNDSQLRLNSIKKEYPDWIPSEEIYQVKSQLRNQKDQVVDENWFENISDFELVKVSRKLGGNLNINSNTPWETLCKFDWTRALRGLISYEDFYCDWPEDEWKNFLLSPIKNEKQFEKFNSEHFNSVFEVMKKLPSSMFQSYMEYLTTWFIKSARHNASPNSWIIWNRIFECAKEMDKFCFESDYFLGYVEHPLCKLVIFLLFVLDDEKTEDSLVNNMIIPKLNEINNLSGDLALLVQVKLVSELGHLFRLVPEWTSKKIIPLLDWSIPNANFRWSALLSANILSSIELFEKLKPELMELFDRSDVPDNVKIEFTARLTSALVRNRYDQDKFPVKFSEVRNVINSIGAEVLPIVCRILCRCMRNADIAKKTHTWENVVKPIFESIWPTEKKFRSFDSSRSLIELLLQTGNSFADAFDSIYHHILCEIKTNQYEFSIHSISSADQIIYESAPKKILKLVKKTTSLQSNYKPIGVCEILEKIKKSDKSLANTKIFQQLLKLT